MGPVGLHEPKEANSERSRPMVMQMLDAVIPRHALVPLPGARPPSNSMINTLPDEDQVLLTKLLTEPADYVVHPDLAKRATERTLFGGPAKLESRRATRFVESPDPITDAVAAGERVPTLSYAQEARLFIRFNYARRQVACILSEFSGKKLTAPATRRLLAWAIGS